MNAFVPSREVNVRELGRAIARSLASVFAFVLVLRLAVNGVLPKMAVALLAPASFVAFVAASFHVLVVLGPFARDERGEERPLHRRHGFWLVTLAAVLGLPMLGAFGLVDPWETHYAEVAREMIERRDFISPWWANEGWFMTKPVLTFWLEAIAMKALGAGTGPNEVLAGANGALAHPEWAVRLPAFLLALFGSYLLYYGVSRTCGRRGAFAGGVLLWTMPGFALLSHQAMTDMPLVACVAGSIGLVLRALLTNDAVLVAGHRFTLEGRTIELHAGHALAALFVVLVGAQIVLVVTQPALVAGSPHACGLPSQPACAKVAFAHPRIKPLLQGALWLLLMLVVAVRLASERRAARLFALSAWGLAAIATMAKGPAGLVIPAGAALLHAIATRSYRPLLRLEIPFGLLVAVALIAPWYLAIHARHGRVFLDELVMRHMLGRTLDHLHDTNDGEDVGLVYFIRQLGYATFPWSGIALAGVLAATRRDDRHKLALLGAALLSFTLVSLMRTKFHHYVLVALPPIAMLGGIFLDEASRIRHGRGRRAAIVMHAVGAAFVTALVARDLVATPARFALLFTYRYTRSWISTHGYGAFIGIVATIAVLATTALAWERIRKHAVVALGLGAIMCSAVLLDGYLVRCGSDGGQREVLSAFYRDRANIPSARGPLVAYQLNWKGENYYSGNALAIFISSGGSMRAYLEARRARGENVVWFVTERNRVRSLRAEIESMRAPRSFTEVTGREISAEFTLVRAEL